MKYWKHLEKIWEEYWQHFKTWKDVMVHLWAWLIIPTIYTGSLYLILYAHRSFGAWSRDADVLVVIMAIFAVGLIFAVMYKVGEMIDLYEAGSSANPITWVFTYIVLGFLGLTVLVVLVISALSHSGVFKIISAP